MPRALCVGNGNLQVNLDNNLNIRNLFFPYVEMENHVSGHFCRTGVWVDGRFSWIDDAWDNRLGYKEDSLVTAAILKNPSLHARARVMCFLGVYREKQACQEFGKVLTNIVLKNHLMFGSVSSNKKHFERGIRDMLKTWRLYGDVLSRLITKKLSPTDFANAFNPEREDIKTTICFT